MPGPAPRTLYVSMLITACHQSYSGQQEKAPKVRTGVQGHGEGGEEGEGVQGIEGRRVEDILNAV